jgi:hypothetical protein
MRRMTMLWSVLLGMVCGSGVRADGLPSGGPIPVEKLREHARQLLEALEKLKAPLPAATETELRSLLQARVADATEFSQEVQKLLDGHCLVGVSINPESRVKAARGPAEGRLRVGQERVLLVKVINEGGVTAPVTVSGPGIRSGDREEEGQWLQTRVTQVTAGKGLNGNSVEYVLLRLTAREAGKREATLRFDVGQGTQDLGFRAEVPILFTVEPTKP